MCALWEQMRLSLCVCVCSADRTYKMLHDSKLLIKHTALAENGIRTREQISFKLCQWELGKKFQNP